MPKPGPPSIEREQTDESLRVEREVTDHAIREAHLAVDAVADAIIRRARDRADELLAAARANADRRAPRSEAPAPAPRALAHERAQEDLELREERRTADDALRAERAAPGRSLSVGREETDKDLVKERERSDLDVARRDDFLAMVSHDLRSMLSSITLSAALITEQSAPGHGAPPAVKQAQRIQSACVRMSRLVGDLVDVASIEAGALAVMPEIGDLAEVVTEAVDTFQAQIAERHITLSIEIPRPLPLASFDPARILQVLANLISNALKFTDPGGKVDIRVEQVSGELICSVRDTGAGIPADKLESVFERFLQLKRHDRRGVGLGLYISKCIVQGHGGSIWAQSALGEGSAFYFTIPLEAGSAQREDAGVAAVSPMPSPTRG